MRKCADETQWPQFGRRSQLSQLRLLRPRNPAGEPHSENALGSLLSPGGGRGGARDRKVGGPTGWAGSDLGREAGPGALWWVGLQVGGPTGRRPVSLLVLQRKMAPQKERVSTLPRLQLLVLLLLPLLLVPQPIAGHGGKYSREKNEPEMAAKRESGEEFRMEKLNQLWEKAKRVSGARETRGDGSEELRVSEGEQALIKKPA